MNIMTFNIAHCESYLEERIDYQLFADTIINCNADIIGLNEVRGEGSALDHDNQTKILSELTGIPYYYFAMAIDEGGSKPYGNALLSRFPIVSAQTIPIPDPDPRKHSGYYETRCLLKATLENGITVLVCHFGLNPDEQENAVQTILPYLCEEKCILMGDFNVEPDNHVLNPIITKMKDTASYSEAKLSWPSDAPSVKIDYIFVSNDFEIISADIPAVLTSDHRPHTAKVYNNLV